MPLHYAMENQHHLSNIT